MEVIFVFFVILVGSILQGVSGFGLGLFTMGLLPIMFSLKDSTLLVMFLTLMASLSILLKIFKYIEVKGLLIIISAAFTGRIIAFFLLNRFGEMDSFKKVLGIFFIGMVIYLLFNKQESSPPILMKPIFPILFGFLGGIIGGVFAVGGPFFVFYFLMIYKEKHRYNANLQVTFVLTSLFSLLMHGVHNDFNTSFYMYFLIGGISVIFGANVGLIWFEKLPRERIKKLAMCIVLLAAFNLILFT